jgi:LPPG:FO 2-phospho-L-lactate transferase
VITVLAGGVGAARFLSGLIQVRPPAEITAIVNTGDDVVMHGLRISPDLDTVTYTLAGAINPDTGWGLVGETWQAMGALDRYADVRPLASAAGATWFRLGDKDLATHMYRTHRMAEGAPLSEVTAEITGAWGLAVRLVPMTDDQVETRFTVEGEGELGFQEYFVARAHDVAVAAVRFAGGDSARPAPGVLDALRSAEIIVIAPSNPIISIGPILAVPGLRAEVAARRDRVVAISPIVAGAALKGPADRLMTDLGHEASVVGVARLYRDIAAGLVIDASDRELAEEVERAGMRCIVAETVMSTPAIAAALAETAIMSAGGKGSNE